MDLNEEIYDQRYSFLAVHNQSIKECLELDYNNILTLVELGMRTPNFILVNIIAMMTQRKQTCWGSSILCFKRWINH